ncbi:MAG: RNA pyrophosphohydrolase [Pseudohongiellaceae bacterium]
MIDANGYRPNVGIVICNRKGEVLWAKRAQRGGWQFPQGGIKQHETPEQAVLRELEEEVGLTGTDVKVLHRTRDWLHYRLPARFIRREEPRCIGQKQVWFLLALEADDNKVALDKNPKPEFDDWRWVNYWHPVKEVIKFKKDVYQKALQELEQPLQDYLDGL